jgi:hypothetical protein
LIVRTDSRFLHKPIYPSTTLGKNPEGRADISTTNRLLLICCGCVPVSIPQSSKIYAIVDLHLPHPK